MQPWETKTIVRSINQKGKPHCVRKGIAATQECNFEWSRTCINMKANDDGKHMGISYYSPRDAKIKLKINTCTNLHTPEAATPA